MRVIYTIIVLLLVCCCAYALDHFAPQSTFKDTEPHGATTVDRTDGTVVIADVSVSNTADLTTLLDIPIAANSLSVGNVLKVWASGEINTTAAADDISITGYIGDVALGTFNPDTGNLTDEHWNLSAVITIRTIGAGGTCAWSAYMSIADNETQGDDVVAIDTTTANDFIVKVQWDAAKEDNIITLEQGFVEFKN